MSLKQTGTGNSFYGQKHTNESLQRISEASKILWLDPDHRIDFHNKLSKIRKKNWQNPVYRKTILEGNLSGKNSKLHQKIAEQLALKELGFESEKVLFRYRVDEVNFDKKIIVEINGDYIHANPNKFSADDLIIVRQSQYLAQDKWNYDLKRKEALEVLGFKVFVIWESDNLEERKLALINLLNATN
jgi:very-short-patch-repair endonuclease